MKNLIALIFAFALTACAADRVTLTITVTNAPAGHDTLTINGNVRTWTNSATATPQSLILIGASAGASATNLWTQIQQYGYSGPIVPISFTSSNVITLRAQCGDAFTASASGTWATLVLSTNTCTNMNVVRVPLSSEPTASVGIANANYLSSGMSSLATTPFTAGATLLNNIVQTTGAQSIAGNKTFTSPTFHSQALSISNAYPNVALYFYDTAGNTDNKWTRFSQGNDAFTISTLSDAGAETYAISIDPDTGIVTFDTGVAASIFYDATLTNGVVQNSALGNTNTITGNWRWSRANHTALANGNNAGVDFGTNIFVKIKAGPSAAFAINGIAGGANGRELKIYNSVAQNMTIANDSGVDPVAANRIYTGTGGDIATTGIGFVHLIYDSEDSRWIVQNYQP